jgi:LacI family transcriptional regulator
MKRPSRQGRSGPTIKDVARVARVSSTTVSNVLNGRNDAMTEETLQRIQEAIRTLGFRPSRVARGLVTRHTTTIGLILTEIETPLFLQALPQMELIARNASYNLLLCMARSVEDEQQAINLLLEKQVDGMIFFSSSDYRDDSHILELHRLGLPTILINRANRPAEFTQIHWDQTSGVTAAVKYLYDLGHRRIAHLLGPVNRRSTTERIEGYQRGLEACGLEMQADYLRRGDFTAASDQWRDAALALVGLPVRPTAIIASDDIVAGIVMKTVQNAGLCVPQDISVLGIDDQPLCQYLNPALTTLQLPIIPAGELAMHLMLHCLSDPCSVPEQHTIPCPLIVRDSCGAPSGL